MTASYIQPINYNILEVMVKLTLPNEPSPTIASPGRVLIYVDVGDDTKDVIDELVIELATEK